MRLVVAKASLFNNRRHQFFTNGASLKPIFFMSKYLFHYATHQFGNRHQQRAMSLEIGASQ